MNAIELTTTAQLIVSQFNVAVSLVGKYENTESTACTAYNEKDKSYSIQIPSVNCEYKEEAMSWMRGYLDHEVGHVLFTDMGEAYDRGNRATREALGANSGVVIEELGSVSSRLWDIWNTSHNIVEDGRIERLMARTYPGSRGNLRWLNDKLFHPDRLEAYLAELRYMPAAKLTSHTTYKATPIYEDMARTVAVFGTVVLYAMRWFIYHGDTLSEEMRAALTPVAGDPLYAQALDIARDAAKAVTPEDAYCLADRMLRAVMHLVGDNAQSMYLPEEAESVLSGKPNDDIGSMNAFDKAKLNGALNSVHGALERARRDNDLASRAFNTLKGDETEASLVVGQGTTTDSVVLHEVSALFRRAATAPIQPYAIEAEDMLRAINDVKFAIYGILSTTLQTVTYQRARTGSMGMHLDGRFLARPAYGDGRIFTRKAERVALDTNVSVVLDLSGSMNAPATECKSHAQLATEVAQGMMGALRMLPHVTATLFGYNGHCIRKLEKNQWIQADSTTPTGGAMQFAYMDSVKNSPKARQIMFVVTDGNPDSTAAAVQIAKLVRSKGVDLYGLSIGGPHATPKIVGEENCIVVTDLKDFARDFSHMMRKAFIRRAA